MLLLKGLLLEMSTNRLRLILFSSSFSAFKQFSKFCSIDSSFKYFNIKATSSSKSVLIQKSRHFSAKKRMGEQNVFYFEESKLLTTIKDRSHENYAKLRESIPVVLLLGWTGGKDQHLKKYADTYSSLGFHTIRFSPSDYTTFLDEHTKFTFELLRLMKNEYNLTKNPILVQTFSNACGFIIYQHLINILRKVYDNQTIKYSEEYDFFEANHRGFIADSGFGWATKYFDFINGISNLIEPQVKFKPLRFLIATVIITTFNGYRLMHLGNDYFTNTFKTILSDTRPIPMLFLYSKADKLISSVEISKFIEQKRHLFPNVYIKSVVYDDADHVLLYAKYPQDYLKNIIEHIHVCNLDVKKVLTEKNVYSKEIDHFLNKHSNPLDLKSKL